MKALVEEYGEVALYLIWGAAMGSLFMKILEICAGG